MAAVVGESSDAEGGRIVQKHGALAHMSKAAYRIRLGGEQVLVIGTQDGQPLDGYEGPLALRSLGDIRPGPRHVRNLCAVVARLLDAP